MTTDTRPISSVPAYLYRGELCRIVQWQAGYRRVFIRFFDQLTIDQLVDYRDLQEVTP